eukprot:m.239589 g.239589  ORF g.239589 m.239589 type:complete len:66 (+) comp13940_c0_seq1:1220-1417(+)
MINYIFTFIPFNSVAATASEIHMTLLQKANSHMLNRYCHFTLLCNPSHPRCCAFLSRVLSLKYLR